MKFNEVVNEFIEPILLYELSNPDLIEEEIDILKSIQLKLHNNPNHFK